METMCEELVRFHIKELSQQFGINSEKQPCSPSGEEDYGVVVTDISGDMNHVFRVKITFTASPRVCDGPTGGGASPASATAIDDGQYEFSVVVKMAPSDVLVRRA